MAGVTKMMDIERHINLYSTYLVLYCTIHTQTDISRMC